MANYKNVQDSHDLTSFVHDHSSLIQKIAYRIKSSIPLLHVEFDDLLQSGLLGLLEARNEFDENAGASFTTFATLKIRYAIYEGIRKSSGITREISQNIKKITAAISKLEQSDKGGVTSQQIAGALGVSIHKYSGIASQINTYRAISSHDSDAIDEVAGNEAANPLYCVEFDDVKSVINKALNKLPKREQVILSLYYNEQMNFKEIAGIVDLTEARVSQLHRQTIIKLKQKLTSTEGALV